MSELTNIIADARIFAAQISAGAGAAADSASAALQSIATGSAYQAVPAAVAPPIPYNPGAPPAYTGSRFDPIKFDQQPPDPVDIDTTVPDPKYGQVPQVALFNSPPQPVNYEDETLLHGVPVLEPIDVPDVPDLMATIAGIPVPEIIPIEVPPPPTFVPPEFLGKPPVFEIVPPSGLEDMMEGNYKEIAPIMIDAVTAQIDAFIDREFPNHRVGLAKIEERLNKYLDGGSALSPEIENAIYSRTLDKTNTEARRARDTAWKDAARAGYTMPTAYLLAKRQDIDQLRRDNNARAATDIAIKQAELEQQNLQFAVTQSSNLRQLAINSALTYYGGLVSLNGQALQYATSIVDAVVKSFDIAAKYAEVMARLYETEARIYEAKLQGALAVYQAYAAQIKAIEAVVSVNTSQVNLYRVQLEAVQTQATIYKAQVDACIAQSQIQLSQVQVYQAQVGAYAAQVNASTAKWQGYSAACNGESAKVAASAEAVRSWSAEVQAYSAEVAAASARMNGQAASAQAQAQAYSAYASAFSAQVQAESASVQAEIASFESQLKGFTAGANAQAEHGRALMAHYEVAAKLLINESQMQFQYLKEANDMRVAQATGLAKVYSDLATNFSATAQAALTGMNTLASLSESV